MGNSTDFIDKPCDTGYYCPNGTTRPDEFPCPAGTFNPDPLQTNITACQSCTPGWYCLGNGNTAPDAECSEGWYCSGGATQSMPSNMAEGGECYPGTFCPQGSDAPLPCTPGFYCGSSRLPNVTGECNQGNKKSFIVFLDVNFILLLLC